MTVTVTVTVIVTVTVTVTVTLTLSLTLSLTLTLAKGEIDAFLDQLRLADKFSKGFAGEAKIVDEEGYELRNPTPDPNQPRL